MARTRMRLEQVGDRAEGRTQSILAWGWSKGGRMSGASPPML